MKNKIGAIKITICAVFLIVSGAAFFLPFAAKMPVIENSASAAEDSQSCAACHKEEFDARHRIILKRAAAGNAPGAAIVSCAECHGNAAEHLAAKTSVRARLGFPTENKIVNPKNLSSDAAMLVCAQCHAGNAPEKPKFEEISDDRYVVEFLAAHRENDFDAEKVWADGSSKFSGSEYQAVLRSVCYAQSKAGGHGISGAKINCANCHSAHETNVEFAVAAKNQNQNCINCHAQFTEDAAIVEHTRHPLDSETITCASCHQPAIVSGRNGFVRTHEISVPDPALTIEKQIPNACNLCHTGQSVNWAVAASKNFWSERFRDAKVSPDKQFDLPESLRLSSSKDEFLRTLATDSRR